MVQQSSLNRRLFVVLGPFLPFLGSQTLLSFFPINWQIYQGKIVAFLSCLIYKLAFSAEKTQAGHRETSCSKHEGLDVIQFLWSYVIQYTSNNLITQMDCQPSGNKYVPRTTLQSTEEHWSEEREVFYYSNFDLFNCTNAEQEFYQFSTFVEKVITELGRDWLREASYLYSPYLSSNWVFMALMELWLGQHPPTNSFSSLHKIPAFSHRFVNRLQQRASEELSKSHPGLTECPPSPSLKAVCLGFYVTATETWEQLFQAPQTSKVEPLSNSLLRGVQSSITQSFRPLMVISEKISSVFGRKKRKYNEQLQSGACESGQFDNCYHEFRKTLDIEKQLERKMSDLDLDFDLEQSREQDQKRVQRKQFGEEEAPIQDSLLGNVYSYVTGFLQRNASWRVASSFVTQILEMNQVVLAEGKKVKVMRPAQDFYRKLVMAWLMLQKQGEATPSFTEYLSCLQTAFFAHSWHQRYLIPTKYFFERMRQDWHQIPRESCSSEKQVLSAFLRLIRKGMKREWEQKMTLRCCS